MPTAVVVKYLLRPVSVHHKICLVPTPTTSLQRLCLLRLRFHRISLRTHSWQMLSLLTLRRIHFLVKVCNLYSRLTRNRFQIHRTTFPKILASLQCLKEFSSHNQPDSILLQNNLPVRLLRTVSLFLQHQLRIRVWVLVCTLILLLGHRLQTLEASLASELHRDSSQILKEITLRVCSHLRHHVK